ncbi:MAG: ThiF family adenylyltransferase [Candidatus Hodarchaeota archaeon]
MTVRLFRFSGIRKQFTDGGIYVLSKEELDRYDRQVRLHKFGMDGQIKLKKTRAFVAGIGGLGSPVLSYLTVAGVGKISLADSDKVELSNLNRQILHWNKDISYNKAESARDKLLEMNPNVNIRSLVEVITKENASNLIGNSDLIVDCMDNYETRYLLNQVALEKGIPLFHGAVYGFEGQVTTIIPGKTPCLRCIFPEAPPEEVFPVVGVTPGVIGCIQAMEVIKFVIGVGNLITNRLLVFDGIDMEFINIEIRKNPNCLECGNR